MECIFATTAALNGTVEDKQGICTLKGGENMRAYFVRFSLTGCRYTSFTFVAKDDEHALDLISSFVAALCDDKPNYELSDTSVTTKPRKIVEF